MRVVRLATSLANLIVALAVALGAPQWYALEPGAWVPTSARTAFSADAFTPDAALAEPRAVRGCSRSHFATAWKSAAPHLGIVPRGVIHPSSHVAPTLARTGVLFRTSAATSSDSVRGPPVDR